MMIPHTEHLPKAVLLDLLPAAFEPWGSSGWYPSRPPTPESIARIEAALRLTLPSLFIEIAAACSSYGGWFNSIGDDYESHAHILSLNAGFRAEGLPPRYVLMNHGHDGDCDAWDLEASPVGGELPIVYFNYELDRRLLRGLRFSASSFADYIDAFVRAHAPRCPVDRLRRHAKRVLAQYGDEPIV
ncbi:MAG: SMI1/KNR4 family protein [Isosphaeraceae bacterium]